MKKYFFFLFVFCFSKEVMSQDSDWNGKRLMAGGAISYLRTYGGEDYLFLGFHYPVSKRIHAGISYGYFSRIDPVHQIGATLGYKLGTSGPFLFFVKTDISLFSKALGKNSSNDKLFYRHSLGLGCLTRLNNVFFLDAGLNFLGLYYGRNEVEYHSNIDKVYTPSEFKLGLGYQF